MVRAAGLLLRTAGVHGLKYRREGGHQFAEIADESAAKDDGQLLAVAGGLQVFEQSIDHFWRWAVGHLCEAAFGHALDHHDLGIEGALDSLGRLYVAKRHGEIQGGRFAWFKGKGGGIHRLERPSDGGEGAWRGLHLDEIFFNSGRHDKSNTHRSAAGAVDDFLEPGSRFGVTAVPWDLIRFVLESKPIAREPRYLWRLLGFVGSGVFQSRGEAVDRGGVIALNEAEILRLAAWAARAYAQKQDVGAGLIQTGARVFEFGDGGVDFGVHPLAEELGGVGNAGGKRMGGGGEGIGRYGLDIEVADHACSRGDGLGGNLGFLTRGQDG